MRICWRKTMVIVTTTKNTSKLQHCYQQCQGVLANSSTLWIANRHKTQAHTMMKMTKTLTYRFFQSSWTPDAVPRLVQPPQTWMRSSQPHLPHQPTMWCQLKRKKYERRTRYHVFLLKSQSYEKITLEPNIRTEQWYFILSHCMYFQLTIHYKPIRQCWQQWRRDHGCSLTFLKGGAVNKNAW